MINGLKSERECIVIDTRAEGGWCYPYTTAGSTAIETNHRWSQHPGARIKGSTIDQGPGHGGLAGVKGGVVHYRGGDETCSAPQKV